MIVGVGEGIRAAAIINGMARTHFFEAQCCFSSSESLKTGRTVRALRWEHCVEYSSSLECHFSNNKS